MLRLLMSFARTMSVFVLLVWSSCYSSAAATAECRSTQVSARSLLQTSTDAARASDLQSLSQEHLNQSILPGRISDIANATNLTITSNFTGVKANMPGDLKVVTMGIVTNAIIVLVCMSMFTVLRKRYPLIYSYNKMKDEGAMMPELPDTLVGWIRATFQIGTTDAALLVGLDTAMMLEFLNLCAKILCAIGLPLLFVLAPLNVIVGGNTSGDMLSRIGIGNIPAGHPWMYHVYAVFTVFVCLVLQKSVYQAQKDFLDRRFIWMKTLPEPRISTVLVQNIPEEEQSEEAVKAFFEKVFPKSVEDVHMVLHTDELECLVAARNDAAAKKRYADSVLANDKVRLTTRLNFCDEPVDSITYYEQEISELDPKIREEQERLKDAAQTVGGVNSSSCFVTFKKQREAVMARHLQYTSDSTKWVVAAAPKPSSILWSNLRADDSSELVMRVAGYAATFGVFLIFMPFVATCTGFFMKLQLGPLWTSLAPSLGLTLFLSFLPTVLLMISDTFFCLSTVPLRQHSLQCNYFAFQTVFVLLVSALDGGDFLKFLEMCVRTPLAVPHQMASTMPAATHFYLHFMLVQWITQGMYLTRWVTLCKFISFRALYTEDDAKEMAEPEDQDYYGIGAKSATFTIFMLICVVFGTMSPALPMVGCLTLLLCKLVNGHLAVFAETQKPDLGGPFWVTQMKHLLFGTMIYCTLMGGVVYDRCRSRIPATIIFFAFLYTAWHLYRFDHKFQWEHLPVIEAEASVKSILSRRNSFQGSGSKLVARANTTPRLNLSKVALGYRQSELDFEPGMDSVRKIDM